MKIIKLSTIFYCLLFMVVVGFLYIYKWSTDNAQKVEKLKMEKLLKINCWSSEIFHLNDFSSECIFKVIWESLLLTNIFKIWENFSKVNTKRYIYYKTHWRRYHKVARICDMYQDSSCSWLEHGRTSLKIGDIHTDNNNDHCTRSGH